MDQSDTEQSSDVPSPGTPASGKAQQKDRGPPCCGRCRNHGIIVPLKGHKKDCKNRDCKCGMCILGVWRRDVMARQNALVKQQQQGQPQTPPQPQTQPQPARSYCESPALDVELVEPASPSNGRSVDLEAHYEDANGLLSRYSLPVNALPFAYAVMSVAGDFRTACELIEEATEELNPRRGSVECPCPGGGLPRAGPSAFKQVPQYHISALLADRPKDLNGNRTPAAAAAAAAAPLSLVMHEHDRIRGCNSRDTCRGYSDSTPSPPHY